MGLRRRPNGCDGIGPEVIAQPIHDDPEQGATTSPQTGSLQAVGAEIATRDTRPRRRSPNGAQPATIRRFSVSFEGARDAVRAAANRTS